MFAFDAARGRLVAGEGAGPVVVGDGRVYLAWRGNGAGGLRGVRDGRIAKRLPPCAFLPRVARRMCVGCVQSLVVCVFAFASVIPGVLWCSAPASSPIMSAQ